MKLIRLVLIGMFAVTTLGIFSGCETTKGVGRDIENAGDELEDVVD